MAFPGNTAWYISTAAWSAVAPWAANTAYAAGDLVRQLAAQAYSFERVFVCIVAGTSHATTEPTWTLTRGAKTTDNTVTWQEVTGIAGLNGDTDNTPNWTTGAKNTAITLGHVIKSDDGTKLLICTTAGTAGNGAEPSWSNTVGGTTADGATLVWTTLKISSNKYGAWAAPSATMLHITASTWGDANNQKYYISSDHAENRPTAGSIATSRGSSALPQQWLSVDRAGSVPPVEADLEPGAVIECSGDGNMDLNGWFGRCFGVTFKASDSGNVSIRPTQAGDKHFEQCTFWLNSTGSGASVNNGNVGNVGRYRFTKCGFRFGAATQGITCSGGALTEYIDCFVDPAGTSPTRLFGTGSNGSLIHCRGCDWSLVTTTLAGPGSGQNVGFQVLFEGCKVNASLTNFMDPGGSEAQSTSFCYAERCDNGSKNWQQNFTSWTQRLDAVSDVVRTDGATAPDGQQFSWKNVTTANCNYGGGRADTPKMLSYNSVTSLDVTVTLYGIANAASMLTATECFVTVEYPGELDNKFTCVNTFGDTLATAANLTADTSSWSDETPARQNSHAYVLGNAISLATNPGRVFFCTTAGTSAGSEPAGYASAVDGDSVTDGTAVFRAGWRFKIEKTLTTPQPQIVGNIIIQASVGKPSTTVYIDPAPVVA